MTDFFFDSRPIVLLLPPGQRRATPALGCAKKDFRAVPPSPDLSHLALLRHNKVGGPYWREAPSATDEYDFIVSISHDAQIGLCLWRHAHARRVSQRGIVVVEGPCDLQPLIGAGVPFLRDVEPHSLAQYKPEIFSETIDNLAVVGISYGCAVFVSRRDGAIDRLRPEHVSGWLKFGVDWCSPFDGRSISYEKAVEIATDARRAWEQLYSVGGYLGIAWWKRESMRRFLDLPGKPVSFSRNPAKVIRHAASVEADIAVWTSRLPGRKHLEQIKSRSVQLRLVEDGFLRSAGLGSDLFPPLSIVVDKRGIYFDASKESDLENILQTTDFAQALIKRAGELIDTIVEQQITKYGIDPNSVPDCLVPPGATCILVPGQVADDLSVRLGSPEIRDNLTLLKTVRLHNPTAFIIYRPHPDVDAGHRAGYIPDSTALRYANRVFRGGSMAGVMQLADEIHTMTSLAGFEALIRGKIVVTYGLPFYAGWGLTRDHQIVLRRNRKLSVEELVAATLILYPTYLDPITGLPCGPEVLISRLSDTTLWRLKPSTRVRRLQGRIRHHFGKIFKSRGRQAF